MILAAVKGPHIDWAALSPLVALTGGACLVLLLGLAARALRAHARRAGAGDRDAGRRPPGSAIWQWNENASIIAGALAIDDLTPR